MSALSRISSVAFVTLTTAGLALTAGPAFADGPGSTEGEVTESGKRENDNLTSKIVFDLSKNGAGPAGGPLTTQSATWSPPPCWYEPTYTPKELKADHEKTKRLPHASGLGEAVASFEHTYVEGNPYKNYNLAKTGKGMFWHGAALPYEEGGDIFACNKAPFWVDNGVTPKVENAVSSEVLAELAYAKIKIPSTEVDLSPANNTKVNLPTWAWLDKAEFKPVAVTASLNAGGLNIQATTTAKPVALKLEPGTTDARTFPASGVCRINDDGSIGEPYAKGKADQDPPCGIAYLRKGTYDLQATITWQVSWEGTGNPGPNPLPDGTFGNDQQVVVQEIQSINR